MTFREEQFGDARLILGDCLEVLDTISQVNCIATDPPYEDHMHKAKENARGLRLDGYASPKPVNFDSITDIRDLVALKFVKVCAGWVLAFCTPEGITPWRDALEAAGARYKRACFWSKPDAAPQFNGQGPAMAVEPFVTAWCGSGVSKWNGGGRRNLFTHLTNQSTREGTHPTEKPIPLMQELVNLFSNEGETVCDPFMGSGTTGIACLGLDRKFIGVEKDETYFDLACRRIEAASKQPRLFREPPMKQIKLAL